MITREETFTLIGKELARAAQARTIGNEGMVRVCARRAVGAAVRYWLQKNPRSGWRNDAMSQLRDLQRDDGVPAAVREAAGRLATQIKQDFTSPHTTDPIVDSRVITDYFMGSVSPPDTSPGHGPQK